MSDFDRLKHGKISRNEFRRGLKVLFSHLTSTDLDLIENKFLSQTQPEFVEYSKFADEVESVFTQKGLERNPLCIPDSFKAYSNGWAADPFEPQLSQDEDAVLKGVLKRLNSRIATRRLDALAYMEDYDFVKEGFD